MDLDPSPIDGTHDDGPVGEAPLLIACLCADWCRVCDGYRSVFEALGPDFPAHRLLWIDIEDDEDLVDGLDIEQFPTLMIGRRDELRFLGALPPLSDALRRTVRAAERGICIEAEAAWQRAWSRLVEAKAGRA